MVAHRKKYLKRPDYMGLVGEYNECSAMLRAIYKAIGAAE
jgi:hypothetical protein